MANKAIDLTGQKFGRLTVVKRAVNCSNNRAQWLCHCECGNYKTTRSAQLRSGNIKSCGCLAIDNMKIIGKMPNKKTHGMSKSPIYSRWCDMIKRCYSKNNKSYMDYGGRGIAVCERWLCFENFYEDMIIGFHESLTLERINNEDGYHPLNCRWATRKEQSNNSRRNKDYNERYGLK